MVFLPAGLVRGRKQGASRRLSIVTLAFLVGLVFGVPASQAATTTESSLGAAIVNLINKDRAARGLAAVGVDSHLVSIAGQRAAILADQQVLSHSAPGDLQAQLNSAGVAWQGWGENLAMTPTSWGPSVATALYALWKGSPGHWALIISSDFNRIGVGVSQASSGASYSSIVFIRSPNGSGVAAAPKPAPKATPKPAPKVAPKVVATPAPTPEPTPEPQLWIADPSGGRPDGEVGAWSPWGLVEWFAATVESVAEAVAVVFAWIASIGGRLASLR